MLEVGLRQKLLAITGLTTLVGTRIYAVTAPEDLTLYPCVTYQRVSYEGLYTADGSTELGTVRVVISAYSQNASDVAQAREAIRKALTGYIGDFPDGTHVFFVQVVNATDDFETDARLYKSTLHLMIQYSE